LRRIEDRGLRENENRKGWEIFEEWERGEEDKEGEIEMED
jgi:hypothetical protein